MKSMRQLAAIMFTDIVGYTALMGEDEKAAFKLLEYNRNLHKSVVQEFNGKYLKEMGDGMLLSFDSASDAVLCARKIQETYLNEATATSLKIGIHVGEVVFTSEDVFGDGVNIASRIESLTPAGSIYLSESVYRNIENQKEIYTDFVGEKTLKNVKYPVKIYKIRMKEHINTRVLENPMTIAKSHSEKSIAVLPFVNMSSDPEQEYFCDGIAEEIINTLTHISQLKVIARTSAFAFKNQNVDVRIIGNKLGVNYLLEGSVRKVGAKLRIMAQLIKLDDGTHMYSERFDRELSDIFEIQDEISLSIVDKLKIKLLKEEKRVLLRRYTENSEVFNLYLLGRHHNYLITEEDSKKAKEYLESALGLDPHYVPAYVALGFYYLVVGGGGLNIIPPKIAMPKAKELYHKALQIDSQNADAHSNLSFIYNMYEWQWEKGNYHAKKAIELEPNNAEAHRFYAWDLTFQGKSEQALERINMAIELDPLQPFSYQNAACHYYFARQYEKSILFGEKTLKLNSHFSVVKINIGMSSIQIGDLNRAIEVLESLTSYPGLTESYLGYAYALSGLLNKAEQTKAKLHEFYNQRLVSASGLALVYLGFNEKKKAMDLIEDSLSEKPAYSWHTSFLMWDPIWDSIREEKQFKSICRKLGF